MANDLDIIRYREGYPGQEDNLKENKNLEFYSNKRISEPNGDYIDNIHKNWFGKYDLLEKHHGYIQWLFPIRETGVNCLAQILYPHESKAIQSDPTKILRIIRSYELMLDFYGIRLVDRRTGLII